MKQLGEICFASSDFMQVMDNSIKDDSTLAENSVSELMASGKNLIAETKDAIVTIVEPNISTKSDDSGIFIFEKVAAGFYTVKASAVTYLPVTLKKVAVNGNAETNLGIVLDPEVSPV